MFSRQAAVPLAPAGLLLAGFLFASTPALAQSTGGMSTSGGGMSAPAPVPTVQPSSGGTSQVRQPPQNSVMRGSASGAGGQASANPQGMAGMGAGMSSGGGMGGTNALTLSSSTSQRGGMGGQSSMGSQGAMGGQGSQQAQGGTTISDTGVTQRTPTGSGSSQR